MFYDEYINGNIQRNKSGQYNGIITVDGIDLSPIEATFFEEDGKNYLWLKRKLVKEYDFETSTFKTRKPKPEWEVYLEKQIDDGAVAYNGTFYFMRWRYSISAVWDYVFGKEKTRLNLFVEKMSSDKQVVLTSINERKLKEQSND